MRQVFKTLEGALKRASFENAHCGGRWRFHAVRCLPDGQLDESEFVRGQNYTYRLRREKRAAATS
jgi:hypothetical protein